MHDWERSELWPMVLHTCRGIAIMKESRYCRAESQNALQTVIVFRPPIHRLVRQNPSPSGHTLYSRVLTMLGSSRIGLVVLCIRSSGLFFMFSRHTQDASIVIEFKLRSRTARLTLLAGMRDGCFVHCQIERDAKLTPTIPSSGASNEIHKEKTLPNRFLCYQKSL
jgi:hypothetical protein